MLKYSIAAALSLASLSAFAYDVPATNCEVFIDKLQITTSSHGLTTVNVFLKVKGDLLNGSLTNVGVYHNRDENRSDRSPSGFDFRTDNVPSFLGASDYFQFSTVVGHDWMSARETAAFFVDTSAGTRYWVNYNNLPSVNFTFDNALVNQLYRQGGGYYRSDAVHAFGWDVSSIQQTADYPADLAALFNPKRCR